MNVNVGLDKYTQIIWVELFVLLLEGDQLEFLISSITDLLLYRAIYSLSSSYGPWCSTYFNYTGSTNTFS